MVLHTPIQSHLTMVTAKTTKNCQQLFKPMVSRRVGTTVDGWTTHCVRAKLQPVDGVRCKAGRKHERELLNRYRTPTRGPRRCVPTHAWHRSHCFQARSLTFRQCVITHVGDAGGGYTPFPPHPGRPSICSDGHTYSVKYDHCNTV